MSLSFCARHLQGEFRLDVAFESKGRLTALFGPSGSGKTTIVNLIGGLMRPQSGRIVTQDRVLVDTQARRFVPMHRRRIGYVFQDARLFPHLTVSQNLRYGRFFTPQAERYGKMSDVVDLLGISHLLERRPALLSGGERQRVAIGRALVASPRLLLMDEPLAALDDARKAEIMPYIERLRDETGIPIVYVSHSVAEVVRLATDIVVLDRGKVVAAGPAEEALRQLDIRPPKDEGPSDVAAVVSLTVTAQDEEEGLTTLESAGGKWHLPALRGKPGDTVRIVVHARDVMIATTAPKGLSALNIIPGRIVAVSSGDGPDALVSVDCGGDNIVARVTGHSVRRLALEPGRQVHVVVKAVRVQRV